MYNMNISILGYKLNVEILILIGVVYLILVGHTVYSCCNCGLMEGMTDLVSSMPGIDASGNIQAKKAEVQQKIQNAQTNLATQSTSGTTTATPVTTTTSTEGFTGANINYGESSMYDLSGDNHINTSSWSAPNMTVVPGQPLNAAVKKFMAREHQPVPLPEGEMLLFANTPFKPECCPNTYSNGSGCACMTGKQFNYLKTRGSNNVPYSEY